MSLFARLFGPKPIYIFDLDGTLADCAHRLHYISGEKKDWRAFFAASAHDAPINHVIQTLQALRRGGAEIWVWTGRSDEVVGETEQWLHDHGIFREVPMLSWEPWPNVDTFRMRKAGDHRRDDVLKAEWLSQVEPPEFARLKLGGVFEDRGRVVAMWRECGIPCYQVAPGDF